MSVLRPNIYGIPFDCYLPFEAELLLNDITGKKKINQDQWAMIIESARKRMREREIEIQCPICGHILVIEEHK
jgi:hypothetical protein